MTLPNPKAERQFDDGDWHIKFATGSDKKLAWEIKERLNLPIGEVVGRALRHWVESERSKAAGANHHVIEPPPDPFALLPTPLPMSLSDLLLALQVAQALAALRTHSAKDVVEARFVRGIRAQLARHLGVLSKGEKQALDDELTIADGLFMRLANGTDSTSSS